MTAWLDPSGVDPSLAKWQRGLKRARRLDAPEVNTISDLRAWAEEHRLPDRLEDMLDNKAYAVPMPYDSWPDVDAVVLTGKTQVNWMLQLVEHGRQWVLHVDGKHKLHQGDWLLVTMGTHAVELRTRAHCQSHAAKVVHAFRPLVYMFSRGHEDSASLRFAFTAMEVVAQMCAAAFSPQATRAP